jgi:hypothetical protein
MKYSRRLYIVLVPFLRILRYIGQPKKLNWLFGRAAIDYTLWVEKLIKDQGPLQAAKQAKYVYSVAKRVALGLPVLPQSGPFWFKSLPSGLPRKLRRLSVLVSSRRLGRVKYALLVFSLYRLIRTPPVVDFSSRLKQSNPRWDPTEWRSSLERLSQKFRLDRISIRSRNLETDPWIGTKGPSGLPSIIGSHWDVGVLTKHPNVLQDVFDLIKFYRPKLSRKSWETKLIMKAMLSRPLSSELKLKPSCLARFVFISEDGAKTRGVTPVNYQIQVALKPIHEYFMEVLRRIPMDASFNEARALEWVKRQSGLKRNLDSIDLSDATDRFPLKLMRETVSYFLGDKISHTWFRLMSIPIYSHDLKRSFKFSVGAPMGIYALWPVYALTHHVMVQVAASRIPYNTPFRGYRIRGDDIVLSGRRISREYEAIADELCLPFSSQKTLLSSRDGSGVAEFAKRIFRNGVDLTPFSIKSLVATCDLEPFESIEFLTKLDTWMYPVRVAKRAMPFTSIVHILFEARFRSSENRVKQYVCLPWNENLHSRYRSIGYTVDPTIDVPIDRKLIIANTRMLLGTTIQNKLKRELQSSFEGLSKSLFKRPDQEKERLAFLRWSTLATRVMRLEKELQTMSHEFFLDDSSPKLFPTSRALTVLRELEGYDRCMRRSRRLHRMLTISQFSKDLEEALRWSLRPPQIMSDLM